MGHDHLLEKRAPGAGGRLVRALVVNSAFLLLEVALGIIARSMALLGDAAHNFSDSLALTLSLVAVRMAARPPTRRKTYGYHRLGILAAFVNSAGVILICFFLFYESLRRLARPVEVRGWMVVLVAGLGFLVNGTVALWLRKDRADLNLRSAFLHLLTDAAVSLGVVVSGTVILLTGWYYADPLITMVIGLLILVSAFQILRESAHILMESVPLGVNYEDIQEDMLSIPGVLGVHDLHIWEIGSRQYSLSAHLVVSDTLVSRAQELASEVKDMLRRDHRVIHAILELESEPCAPGEVCHFDSP